MEGGIEEKGVGRSRWWGGVKEGEEAESPLSGAATVKIRNINNSGRQVERASKAVINVHGSKPSPFRNKVSV